MLVSLAGLATGANAFGQAQTWKPSPNLPLEKYECRRRYIYRLDTSPRMISPHGAFTSYQVNVDAAGNNIVGDAANEPSIAMDPNNPLRMAIGWRQFDTWQSNFRQGGYGFTTDCGSHWTFPGVLQPGVFRSDPVTASDDAGDFFYLSLRSDGFSFFCDDMWRSINGGATWSLISGKQGAIGGDKQWFTIDKTCGPGRHFQYQAWTRAIAPEACSIVRPTQALTGNRRSIFPISPYSEPSTWTATEIFMSAAKGTFSGAPAQATRRLGIKRLSSTKTRPSISAVGSAAAA